MAGVVVSEQGSVDDLDELPLEGTEGLVGCLGFGEFAILVGTAGTGSADLGPGDQVNRGGEGPVAAAVDPLTEVGAAGGVNGGGAGVTGVVIWAVEAGDVAAVPDELDRQHGADAKDLQQSAGANGEEFLAAGAVGGQLAVQAAKVGQQLMGQGLALVVSGRGRLGAAQQPGRSVDPQRGRGPPATRSRSSRCSRLVTRRRSWLSSSRRSASSRTTAGRSSSAPTRARVGVRRATSATERASA